MAEMKQSSSIPTIATIEIKNHEESNERIRKRTLTHNDEKTANAAEQIRKQHRTETMQTVRAAMHNT
jgi:hypothetical protein